MLSVLRKSKLQLLWLSLVYINPLAYTDVPETAGLARSINP